MAGRRAGRSICGMQLAPLEGPEGLYNVSVMPRFLLDSRRAGWQGAYFTDVDVAAQGAVDHGHERYCVQRGLHREQRRPRGTRRWLDVGCGFSVWRAGDEQRFDWRQGGRSQFLFLAPQVVSRVLGDTRALPPLGHAEPRQARMLGLIFDALEADLAQGSPAGPLVGDSLISALVAQLAGETTPRVAPAAVRGCDRAVEMIEAQFSRGLTLQELADAAGLGAVWARIAANREHSWIRYNVPEPVAGTVPVEVRLLNNRDVMATTEVTISTAAPNVVIDLPRESRSITVPNLDQPVELQLATTVSWLDGQQREVTAAQLMVNGQKAADIPVNRLSSFAVPISNLIIGDNRLEVVATDSQGITSTSAPVIITVAEGDRLEVPEALQPGGSSFSWTWLLWLLALVGLVAAGLWLWRNRNRAGRAAEPAGRRSRRRRRGSRPPVAAGPPTESGGYDGVDAYPLSQPEGYEAPFVMAHLEVLDAQTLMPEELTLGDVEVRIGRSPAQAQIAFRDDITVSRYHAVLRLEGSRYRINDAGSTSGTYVNERMVPDYGLQLTDGDEIQLGAVRLRYRQL